jgi:peptidyl-prolyl cis-trans isomerase A (cyclophilin A)
LDLKEPGFRLFYFALGCEWEDIMRSKVIQIAAILCLMAGVAYAQDQTTPPPADSSAAAPADSGAAPADATQAAPADQTAQPAPDNSVAAAPAGPLPIDPSIPAMTGPQILINTSMGNITLQLDYARAPKTTEQVIRYVKAKHYDGTAIYRVAHDALIEMGSFDARGQGRPEFGNKLPLEVRNGLSNVRGTVGLARAEDPESGAADFFINIGDESPLDAAKDVPGNTTGYAVFGKVIAGMDVADKINKVTTGGSWGPMPAEETPSAPILIRSITIVPGTDSMIPAPAASKPAAAAKPAAKKKS